MALFSIYVFENTIEFPLKHTEPLNKHQQPTNKKTDVQITGTLNLHFENSPTAFMR